MSKLAVLVLAFMGIIFVGCDKFSTPLSPSSSGSSGGSGEKPSLSEIIGSSSSANSVSGDCGNPNDWEPDDSALQACLDRGDTILDSDGSPGYLVNGLNGDPAKGLWFARDGMNIRSSRPGISAKIIAGRDLFAMILQTAPGRSVNGFTIEDITFDGKVDDMAPDGTPYRRRRDDCVDGRAPGNLFLQGSGWRFRNNETKNAMCGTGIAIYADSCEIRNNYIAHNGRDLHTRPLIGAPWADGLTILRGDGCIITPNTFVDNTDIDLVSGGGRGMTVGPNKFHHSGKFAFSALNIGNFSGGNGHHEGSVYRNNTIIATVPDRLGMGISIGGHMWNAGVSVYYAGQIINNSVSGAAINLVIDGVYGGEVTGNILTNPQMESMEGGCPRFGYDFTVNPAHVKDMVLQDGWKSMAYDSGECIPPLGSQMMMKFFSILR